MSIGFSFANTLTWTRALMRGMLSFRFFVGGNGIPANRTAFIKTRRKRKSKIKRKQNKKCYFVGIPMQTLRQFDEHERPWWSTVKITKKNLRSNALLDASHMPKYRSIDHNGRNRSESCLSCCVRTAIRHAYVWTVTCRRRLCRRQCWWCDDRWIRSAFFQFNAFCWSTRHVIDQLKAFFFFIIHFYSKLIISVGECDKLKLYDCHIS